MAKSYIHELGDRLSNGFTADNLPKHIKEIAPIMYNDGRNNFNSIQSALNDKFDKYGFFGNTDGKWIGAALSVDGETEVKYWKLCSFTTGNWWTLNFVADVTNAKFDSNVFERKIIAIQGSTPGVVDSALEIREGNNRLYSTRGYGNIIYYEKSGNNVTIYIKARFAANAGQYCRLVSVLSVNSISNLTWYQETTAGTQPENPVKFSLGYKTVKPAGSTSVPVYIGSDGNPTPCTDDFVHDGDVTSTYSSTGTAPVNGTAVAAAINSKADKASSGNGMLAVIDSNGNYGSSGITAYNQSQINGLFSGKVIPALQKRSQIDEQIYEFICNGQTVGKSVKFTDEYSGEDRLTFGLEFAADGTVLQFYLPVNNFEENKWIWDGQTPGGSPAGVVELYAGCIKNTSGNIVPFSAHSNHTIDAYNGSTVVSARHFGGINVGSTTRQDDSFSKVNIVMKIMNVITGKYVVVTFDLGVTSFANGSANQAYAIGVARCNSYGFSS